MDRQEAIRIIKNNWPEGRHMLSEALEFLIPELAESEDEKIRKNIINWLKNIEGQTIPINEYNSAIIWLEKQEEKSDEWKEGDVIRYGGILALVINGRNAMKSNCERIVIQYPNEWVKAEPKEREHFFEELEKQGDKPKGKTALEAAKEEKVDNANKVEHLIPQKGMYYTCIKDYYSSDNTHLCVKGKVYKSSFNGYIDDESHFGLSWTNSCAEKYFEPTKDEDWIVCEHDNVIGKPMQYKEFKEKVNQKFIENLKAQGITPKLRLWNLQDAKDGDVLCDYHEAYDNPLIFILKKFEHVNFGLVRPSDYSSYCFLTAVDRQKFKEGTYHHEHNIKPATKEQHDLLFQKMKEADYEWDAEKKELKKIEQQPAWSEEYEHWRQKVIDFMKHPDLIKATPNLAKNTIDWLKSLRPQNSVTDEELAQAKKDAYNDALDKIEYHSGEPTFADGWSAAIWYLEKRNAQPQNTWKPSEEQMKVLRYLDKGTSLNDFDKRVLHVLIDQLKKLRED